MSDPRPRGGETLPIPSSSTTHTMTSLNAFFVRSSHFLAGNAMSLLLGFITFPILTRALTHAQYGIFGLITTTMFLMVALAG